MLSNNYINIFLQFLFSKRVKLDLSAVYIRGEPTTVCKIIIASTIPNDTGLWKITASGGIKESDFHEIHHVKVTIGNEIPC